MTQKAHSIKAFCEAHDISRNLFYTLKKQGLAPKMISLGKRRLITEEAGMAAKNGEPVQRLKRYAPDTGTWCFAEELV